MLGEAFGLYGCCTLWTENVIHMDVFELSGKDLSLILNNNTACCCVHAQRLEKGW